MAAALERVEILGERLPIPLDAFGESRAGNVFGAFHQLDQPLLATFGHRGEPDTSVAGDDGGDTVAGRRVEQFIPGGLAVVVRVHIDEPWRDEKTAGVDDFARVGHDAARTVARRAENIGDESSTYGDVAGEPLATGAVDDGAALDEYVGMACAHLPTLLPPHERAGASAGVRAVSTHDHTTADRR